MNYSTLTYKSPSHIQRFSHSKRYKKSMELVLKYLPKQSGRLLDFGCADGHLLHMLTKKVGHDTTLHGYDPYPDSQTDQTTIFTSLESLPDMKYDVVCCFEVLEHFSDNHRQKLINEIRSVLKPGGILILSVPIELGPVGLFKGLFRIIKDSNNKTKYTWRNLWRTFWGMPIKDLRRGNGYLDHIGFYFNELNNQLKPHFKTLQIELTPFSRIKTHLINSQIFYVLRKDSK